MLSMRATTFLLANMLAGSLWANGFTWSGKALTSYLEHLSEQGHAIIYSSSLVNDEFVLPEEPPAEISLEALTRVLAPFSLAVRQGTGGVWLVVEADNPPDTGSETVVEPEAPLPEIVVSSSVYNIQYQTNGSRTFLEREISSELPDVGEETMSVIARVPGVASGGVSARHHVRGGALNEQLILFDGLRLYEPFHMKDFHAISSIIDQGAIDGIDFHTASYQARYGDRMSGVVDMGLREIPAEPQTELGLSFFTTSALSMGRFAESGRGSWLVSARRGNLDLIARAVDKKYGQPRYEDLFAHLGWEWSDRTSLGLNFLYSRDRVEVAQLDDSEAAIARYRNNIGWLKIDTDWTENLSSSTILSATDIANFREGRTDVPATVSGDASDNRNFSILGVKQDWLLSASSQWSFRTGFEFKMLDSTYKYESMLEVSAPFDQIFDNAPLRVNSLRASPEGEQYAVYGEVRWKATDKLIVDLGVRWDRQTYSVADTNEQRSPRLNILYQLGPRTEIRAGVGRFYQAQEINELQYIDGITEYHPPQYADHFALSMMHKFENDVDLRIELYQKYYEALSPRFENAFDPLVLLPELQIDRVRIDADDAFIKGAEITLTGNGSRPARWWLSYVWSSTEESVGNREVRRSWDQQHAISGGISASYGQWDLSAAATWHSGWPMTELYVEAAQNGDGTTDLVATTSPRNSLDYESFQSLDVRASRSFPVKKGELTAFIEVSNLSNRENPCCLTYRSGVDTSGAFVLTREQESWLPLVPSLGVIWRF